MEEEKKKTTPFVCIFDMSPCVFTQIPGGESLLDVELNYTSNEYPLYILLMDPAMPKIRNTKKNMMMMSSSHFSGISCFWGSMVHQSMLSG